VVLVGEAVLTKNVPDITDSLRKAVYASGVRQPRPASAQEMQQLQQQMAPGPATPSMPGGAAAGAGATLEPMAAVPSGAAMPQAGSGAGAAPPAAIPGQRSPPLEVPMAEAVSNATAAPGGRANDFGACVAGSSREAWCSARSATGATITRS
jgi:hypothetical protein